MPDILNTSLTGMLAFQRALQVTSHNIANANTPGYTRQVPEFSARIGGGAGSGYVGGGSLLGYTVHGDEVNVAARLEHLNKELGTTLLVSASTRDACGPDRFAFEHVATTTVRGRARPSALYTIR